MNRFYAAAIVLARASLTSGRWKHAANHVSVPSETLPSVYSIHVCPPGTGSCVTPAIVFALWPQAATNISV